MKPPRTIVFLNDLHAGSYYGLWPRDRLPRGGHSGPRYLLRCWEQLLAEWPEKVDLLILNGDLIDGPQKKSAGTGVFAVSDKEQVEGAIELLEAWTKRARVTLRCWGTPYHEGHTDPLFALDLALGIRESRQMFDLDLGSGILNIAHHPMGGAALYQGTTTDREALWSTIAGATKRTLTPRWIVRAHHHHFMVQETEHKTVVKSPCWQLATPYATKTSHWRFQPSLGAVMMIADESHHGGYRFVPRLFPLPIRKALSAEALR